MSGEPFDPAELYRLRRDVHGFLSRYGKFFWAARQQHGQQPRVPPALEVLPAHQRPQALARDEARRLARSRLFFLDEAATGQAARLGAAIRAAAHPCAVRAAGHTGAAAAMNVAPPAPPARCGFLRWAQGLGGAPEGGAPVIACHWDVLAGGTWLVWWADNHITAQRHPGRQRQQYLALSGPLFYEHSMLLAAAGIPATPAPTAPPGVEGPRGGVASEEIARLYTLFGSWLLLAAPDLAALRRHDPTSAEIMADRRSGITPSPVIYGTGRGSRQLAALIHTLSAAGTDNTERGPRNDP